MNIKAFYKKNFNTLPETVFDCGGRFEILGNHTDHNHGLCLAATSDLCITAGVSKRRDLKINLYSFGFEPVNMDLTSFEINETENKSAAMIRGVAKYLVDKGYKVGGFDASTYSTIYPGAGLSSSAAFELLIGQIFNVLFNKGEIDRLTLCKAGQFSENNYFGKKSGLLDQIGVGFGNIVSIDFKDINNPKVEQIGFPFDDLCFVSVNTGGNHSTLNNLYSSIPEDMYNAAKKMGHNFLRECSPQEISNPHNLTKLEKSRSLHFFTENQRVLTAIKALKEIDENKFLKMINESRLSSTNDLQNMMVEGQYDGSPLQACDRAMEILEGHGACKINGGGFAGSIICLVPISYKQKFINKMSKYYGSNNVTEVFVRSFGPRMISHR